MPNIGDANKLLAIDFKSDLNKYLSLINIDFANTYLLDR